MKKFSRIDSKPTYRRLELIGIFGKEDMKSELDKIIKSLDDITRVGEFSGSWKLDVDDELFTAKTHGHEEFEVHPRREWLIFGTIALFREDQYNYNVSIESYRDGIYIDFGTPSSRPSMTDEFRKEVFGDINCNTAFTKDYQDIPELVEEILQDISKYYKKIEGGKNA